MSEPLATLTHARLRAVQGDRRAARRILASILERDPERQDARKLLHQVAGRAERPAVGEREQQTIRRLEGWLARILAGEA